MDGVDPGPILKVDAALGEDLLYGLDELVDEGIKLRSRRARLAHAQVERIVQVLLVVGPGVEIHGKQVLRRHSGAPGIKLQLTDRDPRAVCPEIAEAENAAAVRDADEADILLRPIPQNLIYLAASRHGQIHAARLAVDVAEL